VARPIVMPSLGMYTAEGTVAAWLRPDGASVTAGEPVAEVTTEKATYEIEAPADGLLHAAAAVGATLGVQAVLGYVLAPGESPPATGASGPGSGPHPNPLPEGEGISGSAGEGVAAPRHPLPLGEGRGEGSPPGECSPLAADERAKPS
jgi:pyruvate dehydrogenase E2 component (dihydrolipoamide acetyltransferase)